MQSAWYEVNKTEGKKTQKRKQTKETKRRQQGRNNTDIQGRHKETRRDKDNKKQEWSLC